MFIFFCITVPEIRDLYFDENADDVRANFPEIPCATAICQVCSHDFDHIDYHLQIWKVHRCTRDLTLWSAADSLAVVAYFDSEAIYLFTFDDLPSFEAGLALIKKDLRL
jgi:hypothetical protein